MTGISDFSGFEVVRAAMDVERQGHTFYDAMATQAVNPLARELFALLAQDEVGHLKTLEKLLPRYLQGSDWDNQEEFAPYLKRFSADSIFPSAEQLGSALMAEELDLKVIDLAIEAEMKFAEFFHKAAGSARDPEGASAFAWLAGEEETHARILRERRARITGDKA